MPGVADGYMTPPITPDGTCFQNGSGMQEYQVPPRCPVTPTPTNQTIQHVGYAHHMQQPTYFDGAPSHMAC